MNIIELTGVTKTFNSLKAVDNLSLEVPRESIYGFIGPNGSGKTTTIRMIMNILYPDSGKIRVFETEQRSSRLDRVGYLPEERGLYKKMKVGEILRFHGTLKNGTNLNQEIDYWLEKLDLKDRINKKVETLSKGMSQKLQFIATVIDRPEIVILDEPFSGLDPVNADIIREAVLDLREKGATIIFSTHDMSMAEKMCDYIFMIHQGKKVLDGTLQDIQDQYGSDTIRIQTEKGNTLLKEMSEIDKIIDFGREQEIRIKKGVDPQDILARIMAKSRISKFEITRPSLHDIFVRIARPEKTNNHA